MDEKESGPPHKYVVADLRGGQSGLGDGRVWAGYTRDEDIATDEFLIWCRSVMYPDLNVAEFQDDEMNLRPLDSDEQALEFLARCDYDQGMAKFLLTASLGAANSYILRTRKGIESMFPLPSIAKSTDEEATTAPRVCDEEAVALWLSRVSVHGLASHELFAFVVASCPSGARCPSSLCCDLSLEMSPLPLLSSLWVPHVESETELCSVFLV